jgi:hypothetical protein
MTHTALREKLTGLTDAGLQLDEAAELIRAYGAEEIDHISDVIGKVAAVLTDADWQVSLLDLAHEAAANPQRAPGELVFLEYRSLRDLSRWHNLEGWPEYECVSCGCDKPATTTDDASVPVCGECSEYQALTRYSQDTYPR